MDERDKKLMVPDLIDKDKRWNLSKLRTPLPDVVKNNILQLPIAWNVDLQDGYTWSWAKNGCFPSNLPTIICV